VPGITPAENDVFYNNGRFVVTAAGVDVCLERQTTIARTPEAESRDDPQHQQQFPPTAVRS
jgi:hypothetical protein